MKINGHNENLLLCFENRLGIHDIETDRVKIVGRIVEGDEPNAKEIPYHPYHYIETTCYGIGFPIEHVEQHGNPKVIKL